MRGSTISRLNVWKESDRRKPMLVRGVRRIGKTTVIKEFGNTCYKNYAYFSFEGNDELMTIFRKTKKPHKIVEKLSKLSGVEILPGETLIILDDIHECVEALTRLKYFRDIANEYHIIAAGNYMGIQLKKYKTFLAPAINMFTVQPLNFDEFLEETDSELYDYYVNIEDPSDIDDEHHNRLLEAYRYYMVVGGMPECVLCWKEHKSPEKVSQLQRELLDHYENDFVEYGARKRNRIAAVYVSLVKQLKKPIQKFTYGCVREGSRASEYDSSIEWLTAIGMLQRINNVSKIEQPLVAYKQLDHFKIYIYDTGILKMMAGVDDDDILQGLDYPFEGCLTQNFIHQQLRDQFKKEIYYFSGKDSEIDFIIPNGEEIIALGAKYGDEKAINSFKRYVAARNPEQAYLFLEEKYQEMDGYAIMPTYMASRLRELI